MKVNLNKVRGKRAYTRSELALLLGVNRKTVSRWISSGLQLIDPNRTPILILGDDLRNFIKERRKAKKVTLGPNEIYCFKCKKAVVPKRGSQEIEKTGKKIGKNNRDQEIIYARCRNCNGKVARLI